MFLETVSLLKAGFKIESPCGNYSVYPNNLGEFVFNRRFTASWAKHPTAEEAAAEFFMALDPVETTWGTV